MVRGYPNAMEWGMVGSPSNISSLYSKFILTTTNSVADYHPFKSLYQYSDPEFGALRLTDIAGKEHPHMKAVIYKQHRGE